MRWRAITLSALLALPLLAGGDPEASPAVEANPFWRPDYSWFDVNINYLDWSSGTERRTGGSKKDFYYLELEGGMGWSWGDLYFFTDWENAGKSFDKNDAPDDARWVIKPILDLNIPGLGRGHWYSDFQIHIQDYFLYSDGFRVNNLVLGLAYRFRGEGYFLRPFLGFHYADDNFNPGTWNGYMAGWSFNVDFGLPGQKFSLSNWHEFEFDRDRRYGSDGADGRSWGVNGALALWWHATGHLTAGLQYRYADHKLGYGGYQDGLITTLKYKF